MNKISLYPSFKAQPLRQRNIKQVSKPIYKEFSNCKKNCIRNPFWEFADKFVSRFVDYKKEAKYSQEPQTRWMEIDLERSGVHTRFNNDTKLAQFIYNGIEQLKSKNIPLPKNIIFTSKILPKLGIYGLTYMLNQKEESPIILPRNIADISKSLVTKSEFTSTSNPLHIFFHEVGHWLHHQKGFSAEENAKLYKQNNGDTLSQKISELATTSNDGSDFCAEIFAGQMASQKYSDETINLAKQLKAPLIR